MSTAGDDTLGPVIAEEGVSPQDLIDTLDAVEMTEETH